MDQQTLESVAKLPFSKADWDALCSHMKHSLMAGTSLNKLAKDMGLKWPIQGKDETPERYICFTLEELADLPEFYGKGNRLALLYNIFQEIKHMDDPFVNMTEHIEHITSEKAESTLAIRQLEIPEDFPVDLMSFSKRTLQVCRDGGYTTLGELIEFLEKSASAAIINDEFREFMGYLVQMDTEGLKRLLPIREGSKGIHLAEGLGLLARRLMEDQAATLVHAYRIPTTRPEWGEEAVLPKAATLKLLEEVKALALRYFELMPDQAQELRTAIAAGTGPSVRYFVPLDDPNLESLAMAIAMVACDVKPKFKGLFGSLLS